VRSFLNILKLNLEGERTVLLYFQLLFLLCALLGRFQYARLISLSKLFSLLFLIFHGGRGVLACIFVFKAIQNHFAALTFLLNSFILRGFLQALVLNKFAYCATSRGFANQGGFLLRVLALVALIA